MNLYPVIQILADGQLHSGQELAQAVGVSRTAIWKQLQELEAGYGLRIRAVRGRGYQLDQPLDLLAMDDFMKWLDHDVRDLLTVDLQPVIASTNTALMSAPASDRQFALCAAELQTAGKGRRGRTWFSPFARNLYFSLAFDLDGTGNAVDGLSLVAGLALADGLESLGVRGVSLKWPNDVWVNGRKLAGILVELQGEAQSGFRIVLGVGLNVYLQPNEGAAIDQPWTSLQNEHQLPEGGRNRILAFMVQGLVGYLSRFRREGFESFRSRWQKFDALAGEPLVVPGRDIEGRGAGVDERGCLLLETDQGLLTLNAGEVSIRRVSS